MFSESPGTPGLSAQMPRSTMSIFTPAWLARYSASMVFSSTMELTLILIHASLPVACGVLLAADALNQAGTHGARRHQQTVEARLRRVAGQLVEQAGHILTDHRIAGQQARSV